MWQQYHDKVEVWTEERIKTLQLVNGDVCLDKELNPGLRADFLRIELLYLFGGIYADVDMTCEKSLAPLLGQPDLTFAIGVSHTRAFELNNGIVIA